MIHSKIDVVNGKEYVFEWEDRLHFYVKKDLKDKFRELSKKRGMTMSQLAVYLMTKELEKEKRNE